MSEPTGAGLIGNPQNNCGSFNPASITNISYGSGGSGGSPTYFWQYSTSSSTGPWSNISSNSATYNPSTISQTRWYRRGYYRCNSSGAVYTSAVEMTVTNPTANASASSATICSGNSTTLSSSGSTFGSTYQWRISGNSTVLSTSSSYTVSPNSTTIYQLTVTKNGCSSTDNVTVTVNTCCTEPTNAGSIGNDQSNCGPFNPSALVSLSLPSGGSGGTLTYFWQSASSSSGPWSTISSASGVTYDPPTITQNTWYRRGVYRCNISNALFSNTVRKSANSDPPATASATSSFICSGSSTTLSSNTASNLTYEWRINGNSTVLSTSAPIQFLLLQQLFTNLQ